MPCTAPHLQLLPQPGPGRPTHPPAPAACVVPPTSLENEGVAPAPTHSPLQAAGMKTAPHPRVHGGPKAWRAQAGRRAGRGLPGDPGGGEQRTRHGRSPAEATGTQRARAPGPLDGPLQTKCRVSLFPCFLAGKMGAALPTSQGGRRREAAVCEVPAQSARLGAVHLDFPHGAAARATRWLHLSLPRGGVRPGVLAPWAWHPLAPDREGLRARPEELWPPPNPG